jgi:hypothetical protein
VNFTNSRLEALQGETSGEQATIAIATANEFITFRYYKY